MNVAVYSAALGGLTFASVMAYRLRQAGPGYFPAALGPFAIVEAVSTFGWLILAVAGFFFVPWWVPIVVVLCGGTLVHYTPDRIALTKGPGVVLLTGLAGIAAAVAMWF